MTKNLPGRRRRQIHRACRRCAKLRAHARPVISTNAPRKPFSAKGRSARPSCWWASSRGITKDLAGKPFVGPAALEEAGIDRQEVYVTNAVKHFKWEPRGKRRIHQKPNARELAACRQWLEAELRIVKPKLVVLLGATAAQTIFGSSFRVMRERGKVLSSKFAPKIVATVHPSSLLRQPDEASREREYRNFVADLRVASKAAREK
jgi:uracil-DNA glycosylase family protein